MPQANLQHKSLQKSGHIEGLWVSYTKGKTKISKPRREAKEVALSPLRVFGCLFVVNESMHDVYFIDISVVVRKPQIIQEGHYNPFCLPLAGLTTLRNPEYAFFFTGKELSDDLALEWYDYGARMYDVQIGRWTSHDPLYQFASPYSFCGNDPLNYIDEDGRFAFLVPVIIGAVIGAYAGASIANGTGDPTMWEWDKGSTYRDMFYGAIVGAGTAFAGAAIAAGIGSAAVSGAGTFGAIVGGATAGFTSSLGFAMIQNYGVLDWSDLRRAGYAGLSGIAAGGLGAYIGGYWGAFTGGFTGGAMNTWINGGSLDEGLVAGAIGGGMAVGAYSISMGKAYRDYKKAGGTWNRSQHQKISIGIQRSHARGREWGAWITEDGIESWGFGGKNGVESTNSKGIIKGEVHTHTHINDGETFHPPSITDLGESTPNQKILGWNSEYNLKPNIIKPQVGSIGENWWKQMNGWTNYYNSNSYNIFNYHYAFPFFSFYIGK